MARSPQDPLGIRAVLEAAALLAPLTGPTYLPMASSGTPIYDLHSWALPQGHRLVGLYHR